LEGTGFIQDLALVMLAAALGGWGAKRLGLSPIVGYLLAGLMLGSGLHSFVEIKEPQRMELLSQLGLVLLMFSIGLGLRIQRFKELGLGPILGTFIGAALVMNLTRSFGFVFGLNSGESLFLAGMFMVSSSAIIAKVFHDSSQGHRRHGQLAVGITLLEDVVAVVVLAFLGSYVATGQMDGDPGTYFRTVSLLVGFGLLFLVMGLVMMPRLLFWVSRQGSSELENLLVAGLLFGLSVVSIRAGYSAALGAFLLGVVVGETRRSASIQKAFGGMRDIFTTVFFVSIGMGLDPRLIPESLGLIVGGAVFCLLVRWLSLMLALLIAGEEGKTAFRAALGVTPIGEFSFIIAGMGVVAGFLPDRFEVAAVGIVLLTSFAGPLLIRHSKFLADKMLPQEEGFLPALMEGYRQMWQRVGESTSRNLLWKLSRKRLIQISVEVLLVTTFITFCLPVARVVEARVNLPGVSAEMVGVVYWTLVGVVVMASLLAIWRNISALIMILVDFLGKVQKGLNTYNRVLQIMMQILAGVLMVLWLASILPAGEFRLWALVAMMGALILMVAVRWRGLIRIHSQFEFEVQRSLGKTAHQPDLLPSSREWGMEIEELVLPDYFAFAGRSIVESGLRNRTGCSIISINRQGFQLNAPTPQTHLFPGDNLLLMGLPKQLAKARELLTNPGKDPDTLAHEESLHDTVMETITVPQHSAVCGRSLAQLNWTRLIGVQIAGIQRQRKRKLSPGGDFELEAGDELLVLGSPASLRHLRRHLDELE